MAQLVEHLTLDISSVHDLTVYEFEPCVRLCAGSMEPVWDSLSLSLSAPLLQVHRCVRSLSLSLSLKINTHLKINFSFPLYLFAHCVISPISTDEIHSLHLMQKLSSTKCPTLPIYNAYIVYPLSFLVPKYIWSSS